jgi:long-chain acyl-CoA synthetase
MSPLDQASTCAELFTLMGRQWPQKCALETLDGSSCTFEELDQRTNQLCNALLSQGLQPGDRAAIVARNCPQYLEVFGLTKAGLVTVPLNWRLKAHDLLRLLEHSAPKVVFVDAHHRAAVASLRTSLPGVTHWVLIGDEAEDWVSYEGLLAQGGQQAVTVGVQPRDPACIVYTSGTTGQPKGVTLTHAGVMGNCRTAAREMLELTEHDRTMAVMPLFHVGGMWYHTFPSLASGCTTLILSEFEPACVLRELAARRITNVHLVPTMIAALLQQPDVHAHDLSAVRLMFYAASSMPAELLRAAMHVFSQCGFAQAYGSTEGGVVTVLDREAHERARLPSGEHLLASCGRPMGGRELRIVNDAGQRMALGAIGEIEVRSPDLMQGYWHDEAATRRVLRGGWLATGDLGYLDGEGFVYIADRKNDMIVTGGENVFPSDVEGHLYADPDIAEAAVFGIPDPKWVERVVAAVVLKPGRMASELQVMERLRGRIAGYKCPKDIHLVESLPKSAAGKVLRKELRIQFSQPKTQD